MARFAHVVRSNLAASRGVSSNSSGLVGRNALRRIAPNVVGATQAPRVKVESLGRGVSRPIANLTGTSTQSTKMDMPPFSVFNSDHDLPTTEQAPSMMQKSLLNMSIPDILAAMPQDWRGTTFNNLMLHGREGFAMRLDALLESKAASGSTITTEDLARLGNAEDYLRVASNISTTLEMALAQEKGLDMSQVFTFGSKNFPILAACLTTNLPVHLYLGNSSLPFTQKELDLIATLGLELVCHMGSPLPESSHSKVVLAMESAVFYHSEIDGIVGPNSLYITNPKKICPSEVFRVRKRMCGPVTAPVAESMLRSLASMPQAAMETPTIEGVRRFHGNLQKLCGTPLDRAATPLVSTAGLSALASLWASMVERGGSDVLMCSTSYGGSSELTKMWGRSDATFRVEKIQKHDFHIQGDTDLISSVRTEMNKLAKNAVNTHPNLVLFVEIPTNPDMKVPDMGELAAVCVAHRQRTGKNVILVIDTTFAPGSRVMEQLRCHSEDLPVLCFISMSKSVSRGLTTAGAIVANHTAEAKAILSGANDACNMLDIVAKPDQMQHLVENHMGVVARCQQAYKIASEVGERFQKVVLETTGIHMPLAFVSKEQAAKGFTSATFSFNLPSPQGATAEEKELLAQKFVDLLCVHKQFKPCVSFGQDNGLVYATVPATSTQGAIKTEDKAKQAIGGVQLARLSLPAACDVDAVCSILSNTVSEIYR